MALSLKKGRKTGKRKKDNFRRRTNLSKDDYSSIRKGGGGGGLTETGLFDKHYKRCVNK